jgi:methylated-DNA-[protein]-cysteine S-methyltransferase
MTSHAFALFAVFESPIGDCAVVWGERALIGVYLPEADAQALRTRIQRRFQGAAQAPPPADVQRAIDAIGELLRGGDNDLQSVEIDMSRLPEFNQQVYAIARAIPPGRTRTYGEIAAELGDPLLARAVGQALGANPFPIVVPCHRVMAAGGKSGGFSAPGGLVTKLKLLEIERAPLGGSPGLFD